MGSLARKPDSLERYQADLPHLTQKLRRGSRKITGPRQAILEALRRQSHPVSIKELFDTLTQGDCDLATVYRAMHLLEGMSMVKRFDFGDRVARFELLSDGDDGHHHHLVCTQCAEVVEISDCSMQEQEAQIATRNGFTHVTHKLEFFGICSACRAL